MAESCPKPGYFSVIPAPVRYDDQIPANAKLLYGEISALIGAEGYCFASNSYFAQLYKLSERTITSLVASLQDAGYIIVQMMKDQSGKAMERRIWLSMSAVDGQPVEDFFYTPGKYFLGGVEENFQENKGIYNNIIIPKKEEKEKYKKEKEKTAKTAAEVFDPKPLFVDWIGWALKEGTTAAQKNALYLAMVRFAENRAAIKKPFKSQAAVTALCNKLIKHSRQSQDQVGCMIDLLDTATSSGWQSIYPNRQSPQQQAASGGGREWEEL